MSQLETVHALEEAGQMGAVTLQGPSRPQAQAGRCVGTIPPERYAVAFGGCDPVHFVQTHNAVEGRFLAEHEGRFYMFATRENYLAFRANPTRNAQQSSRSDSVASK